MKILLKIEEFFLFILSIYLFLNLEISWWWFPVLFLTPDLGMLGYVYNTKVGSIIYNLFHHRAISIIIYIVGAILGSTMIELTGIILFGHSSFDRVFDYGLKYKDNFKHTHLTEN